MCESLYHRLGAGLRAVYLPPKKNERRFKMENTGERREGFVKKVGYDSMNGREKSVGLTQGLTSKEGWSGTRTDFEELLAFDSHGCFIGEENSERVSMVCAIPYGKFGNIGNLIVIDECRGRGLGATLMEHAIFSKVGQ